MKIKKSIQAVAESLGLPKLREFQIGPISSILDRRDTLVLAFRPADKAAVYQIPAVINSSKGKWTLVIEPASTLFAKHITRLKSHGITTDMMTKRNLNNHNEILDRLRKNTLTILYITPGILKASAFQSAAQDNPPWLLVVNDAHYISECDPTYLQIRKFIKGLSQRPVVAAFTSEVPPVSKVPICKLLGMKKLQTYIPKEALEWFSKCLNEMSLVEGDRRWMQQFMESMGEDHPTKCRLCINCQQTR